MNTSLNKAYKTLLEVTDISEENLFTILNMAMGKGIDFADLYFQYEQDESWKLEDGIIKTGGFAIDQGVGVRAISGDKTGFAYSDEISLKILESITSAARNIAKSGSQNKAQALKKRVNHVSLYSEINPMSSISENEKIALLKNVDIEARKQDSRVKQVIATLSGSYEIVLIVSSDGDLVADIRPLIRMNVTVIVEDQGRYEQGYSGGGARCDYNFFYENDRALQYAREAVRLALVNLSAVAAPAGSMPVVLGSGWPAVLLHEAVGHGLEGDFVRKGTSVYTDKIGEQVASKVCTIVDHGNREGFLRGSLNIDDEGTPTQCTTLIENGILCGFMYDKLNARLMKTKTTGNGRRESYASIPIPRMTNTYMLPGKYTPEEIIATVDRGLYAVNFSGGQVDITSGEFVFSTSEAYLIEKGKVTRPVKGATLVGNGPKVLNKISMVGCDLALDSGVGTCGKDGQSVPVGVGQPTLKVDELVVGGTE